MNDFLQYILYLFHRGVRFAVPAVLLCVVGLAAAWGIARKQGRSFPWKKAAALLLLIAWLGLTLFVTLFRGEPGYRQWNFHLFLAWKEAWNQFALRVWLNVLLNIALFVPLGILLPLLARIFRRWYVMLLSCFGTSLAIELGQLATGRGMFDVDDLFTNTLGAMVGWGLIMLIWTLREQNPSWKTHCLAYLSIPAALALVLTGIFVSYQMKPYGNLPDAPAMTANLKAVEWELVFTPEDTPTTAQVYQAGRLDGVACEQFATQFAQQVGFTIEDIYYYDDTTWFGNHFTGDFLLVNKLDGTWQYDLGQDTTPVFEAPPEEISPDDILSILRGWGIVVPEGMQLTIQPSEGNGFYTASGAAELVYGTEGEVFYGPLRCSLYYEDGKTELNTIYYDLAALTPCQEEPILSPAQAVQQLQNGRSFQGTLLEYEQVTQVKVLSCTLGWKTDTKGFYQPVYCLELQFQDLGTITDYVAALK